jgi:hypothetical protein
MAAQRIARPPDALDELLALLIVRVGLAGIDDLKLAGSRRNGLEAFDVVEEQVRVFVSRLTRSRSRRLAR